MGPMSSPLVLVVEDHPELGELLAAALEMEGLESRVAATGAEALALLAERRPAAALVDLMLPDMLGVAVLDALAAASPPVPAIAMSGVFRGGRYAAEAAAHGAERFVEKPFSTEEVVTALREIVGADAPAVAEDDLDAQLSVTVTLDEAPYPDAATILTDPPKPGAREPEGPADPATKRRRRMGFVEDLISVGGGDGAEDDAPRPKAAVRRDPAKAVRRRRPPPLPKTGPGRQGDLASTSVPRLLAACHQAGTTGTLRLRRGPVLKVVYLTGGRPVFAASNFAGDRLLTFAVRTGVVRREDAEAAMRLAREADRRVGELLVELGILDRKTLGHLVLDQVRAVVWSTFAWDEGGFEVRTASERRAPLTLELPLGDLVLEGVRRAVPLVALRERLADDTVLFPQPAPMVPLEEVPLDVEGARLLTAADGTKTVGDLVALVEAPEQWVRARLLALVALDVLAPRVAPDAGAGRVGFVL